MNPSDRVQRILDLLDNATQSPGDIAFGHDDFGGADCCWRCSRLSASLSPVGLCQLCTERLRLSETHTEPDPATYSPAAGYSRGQLASRSRARRELLLNDEELSAAVARAGDFIAEVREVFATPWMREVWQSTSDITRQFAAIWEPADIDVTYDVSES